MATAVRVRCSEDDAGGGQKAKRYAGIILIQHQQSCAGVFFAMQNSAGFNSERQTFSATRITTAMFWRRFLRTLIRPWMI